MTSGSDQEVVIEQTQQESSKTIFSKALDMVKSLFGHDSSPIRTFSTFYGGEETESRVIDLFKITLKKNDTK